jgi:hypothetical protein
MEKGWNNPPYGVGRGNQRCPLTIARLDSKWLKTSLRGCYYLDRPSNIHLEVCVVEVVGIFVEDPLFGFDVAYKVEIRTDNSQIAAQDPLVTAKSDYLIFNIRSPVYQTVYPIDSNLATTTCSQQLIGHTTYVRKRRDKSSRVRLSYVLYNYLVFKL